MRPVVFLKRGCPFCLKLRIFLLEAGLLDRVDLRDFAAGSDDERAIAAMLAPHFEKVTYPSAQLAAQDFANGSDELIALFAKSWGVDPSALATLSDYSTGVFDQLVQLYHENVRLKEQLA